MLRRTEKIVLKDENANDEMPAARALGERKGLGALRPTMTQQAPSDAAPEPARAAIDDRAADHWRNEVEPLPQLSAEQRRDIERWRAEVLRSVSASEDEEAPPNRWRSFLKPTNIALLGVALVAGGAAAFLALQQPADPSAPAPVAAVSAGPETVTQVVEEAKVQVLVAKTPIVVGQRLTPDTIEWVEWPEDTTRGDFVTQTAAPDALDTMKGAVARYEFFPGEPIREVKLARAERGFLSAVLDPGTRAVAVNVTAESASGGFILPNDRIDVVLTSTVGSRQVSSTILQNIRVLAIDSQIGETAATTSKGRDSGDTDDGGGDKPESAGPGTFDSAIATLSLDPRQAEVIIAAMQTGRLSLVLRPTVDVADSKDTDLSVRAANEAIRISSPFWAN